MVSKGDSLYLAPALEDGIGSQECESKISAVIRRGQIIELRPTKDQAEYLTRCAGTMRYIYNTLVAKWEAGEKYNRKAFQTHCIALRQSTDWMQEVSSRATYEACDNFHAAASNFFMSCKGQRNGRSFNPPRFKKKGKCLPTVNFSHETQFSVQGRNLRVSGLKTNIRLRERERFDGAVKSVSIKQRAGKWFASFVFELTKEQLVEKSSNAKTKRETVGIDFGLSVLAATSDRQIIENPRALHKKLRLLKRRQRQVSKKLCEGQSQSRRYKTASTRISRLHKKIADQRSAAQHKFTSDIVKRFGKIVIEDLQVAEMIKNRKFSRLISDVGWATLRYQLAYKSKAAGVELVVADKWFASSKICSFCGQKAEKLALEQRIFNCPHCNFIENRDINAALNLATYIPKTVATDQGETQNVQQSSWKTSPQGEAWNSDVANITFNRGSLSKLVMSEHMAVIY